MNPKDIKISIIITARNYGRFLSECIESCLNQTVKPYEIIYSDDYSEDDSIEIAKKFPIEVLGHTEHVGVVKARNNGVLCSTGDAIVHVDGDDKLPKDFLEKHLEVFDENTPFVYCAAQCFGLHSIFWPVPNWCERSIWTRNYVNTSAMIWRDKFLQVGGWKETSEKTMWDWSLFLRLSRLGTPRKSSAILLYRQHGESWSMSKEKLNNDHFNILTNTIRKEVVKVSIGLVYSGRIPNFFNIWLDQLIEDISILNNKPELIIVDNSEKNIIFAEDKKEFFSNVKIITGPGKFTYSNEVDRRNKVCTLLSDNYNRIIENSTGDLIHLREDDIIPLEGSFKKIFEYITDSSTQFRHAVAGIYMNRNINYKKIVGGFYNTDVLRYTQDLDTVPKKEPFKIDFTGTGFLLFWKDLCPTFEPFIEGIQAHDWAWGMKMRKTNKDLWMIPEAVCKHYSTENDYLLPDLNNINPVNNFTKKFNISKNNKLIKKKII